MNSEKTEGTNNNNNNFNSRKIAILAMLDEAIKKKDNVQIDILLKKLAILNDGNITKKINKL